MASYPYTFHYPQNYPNVLPPGWECKYDPGSKRFYYINHAEKTTTWTDPRIRHSQVQPVSSNGQHAQASVSNVHLPQSPVAYGPYPLVQSSNSSPHSPSYSNHSSPKKSPHTSPRRSPLISPRSRLGSRHDRVTSDEGTEQIAMTVLSTNERGDTVDWKEELTNKYGLSLSSHDDDDEECTTFIHADEVLVNKLKTEFFDVPESHIRNLLEKYGNNESAIVKHLRKESLKCKSSSGSRQSKTESPRTSITGSHISLSCRQSQISSRKNSAKYSPLPSEQQQDQSELHSTALEVLKEQFANVESGVLFDVLTSCSGDITKAAYKLNSMGFSKVFALNSRRESLITPIINPSSPSTSYATPDHTPKHEVNKDQLKAQLLEEFKHIDSAVITLALESGEYYEPKVRQLIQIMSEPPGSEADRNLFTPRSSITMTVSQPNSPSAFQITEFDHHHLITERGAFLDEDVSMDEVINLSSAELRRGPDPKLRKGPNKALLSDKNYVSVGPNADLCKGPNPDNAHGPCDRSIKEVLNQGPQPNLLSKKGHQNSIRVTITDDSVSSNDQDSQWLFKLGSKACCWQRYS